MLLTLFVFNGLVGVVIEAMAILILWGTFIIFIFPVPLPIAQVAPAIKGNKCNCGKIW